MSAFYFTPTDMLFDELLMKEQGLGLLTADEDMAQKKAEAVNASANIIHKKPSLGGQGGY